MRLTYPELVARISGGTNPVEVAGYGRESTHKGYLSWMLDTRHWAGARDALWCLLDAAWWPSDQERNRALAWWQTLPASFACAYERGIGGRKIDLLVHAPGGGSAMALPVELKVDSPPGKDQFEEMSAALGESPALVLLLGTMAIRDDAPRCGGYGRFGVLTAEDIVGAWRQLPAPPQPTVDWLGALEHETTRLLAPFELLRDGQGGERDASLCGYRPDNKHLWYARLHSVRGALAAVPGHGASWSLYDGGFNTVLNLEKGPWSWVRVMGDGVQAFWEFNNNSLVLKVAQKGAPSEARRWIAAYQRLVQGRDGAGAKPKAAKANATWVSVMRWHIPLDPPSSVAAAVAPIIRAYGDRALFDLAAVEASRASPGGPLGQEVRGAPVGAPLGELELRRS